MFVAQVLHDAVFEDESDTVNAGDGFDVVRLQEMLVELDPVVEDLLAVPARTHRLLVQFFAHPLLVQPDVPFPLVTHFLQADQTLFDLFGLLGVFFVAGTLGFLWLRNARFLGAFGHLLLEDGAPFDAAHFAQLLVLLPVDFVEKVAAAVGAGVFVALGSQRHHHAGLFRRQFGASRLSALLRVLPVAVDVFEVLVAVLALEAGFVAALHHRNLASRVLLSFFFVVVRFFVAARIRCRRFAVLADVNDGQELLVDALQVLDRYHQRGAARLVFHLDFDPRELLQLFHADFRHFGLQQLARVAVFRHRALLEVQVAAQLQHELAVARPHDEPGPRVAEGLDEDGAGAHLRALAVLAEAAAQPELAVAVEAVEQLAVGTGLLGQVDVRLDDDVGDAAVDGGFGRFDDLRREVDVERHEVFFEDDTLVVDQEDVEERARGRWRRVLVRDDGHRGEDDLKRRQVLQAAVDVAQKLNVGGVSAARGLVDLGAEEVQDQGQRSGGVGLEPEHVGGGEQRVLASQVVHEGTHDPLGLFGGGHGSGSPRHFSSAVKFDKDSK